MPMRQTGSAVVLTSALCAGLIASQLAIMTAPALGVVLAEAWGLNATEMGWLGGVYFAGYALALPFLTGAADRIDARTVYAVSACAAAAASLATACISGFWPAVLLRFVAGVGFAGVHMIGMKMLADRLTGAAQARAAAFYTGAFAVGSGCSFLMAGAIEPAFGWPAAFVVAGLGAAASVLALLAVGPAPTRTMPRRRGFFPDFGGALRTPDVVRYAVAYAGNLWEVFAARVWFVPFLVFNAAHVGAAGRWEPATLAGAAAIIAVPLNLAIAELGVRYGRRPVILVVSLSSVAACGLIGWQATGPYLLIVALLLIHGVTSYGDVGAIAGGLVGAAGAETRGAALALGGMLGFAFGFLGPLAVGLAVDLAGGRTAASAWIWAFAVMALGSVASALAAAWRPRT